MENCIFCRIIGGEIPSSTVYEDDDFKVIMDISGGHFLIQRMGLPFAGL